MIFSSLLLENAVNEFSKLPGIGKKTALRLVLHLLKKDSADVKSFSDAITTLKKNIFLCSRCKNLSDKPLCNICSSPGRNQQQICVVENVRDVIAIESTQQFNGLYHILGGVISPLDGVGPDQLEITSLVSRVNEEKTEELIFALSPNIQGDTTIYYISKQVTELPLIITTISRGIAFGGELEYADEMTLARSISNRIAFENYVGNGRK